MLNVVIAIVRVHELSSSSSSSSPLMFPIEELMAGLLNIGWCIVGPFGPRAKPAFGQPDIPPSKCDGTRDNGKCRASLLPLSGWGRNGPHSNPEDWKKGHCHSYYWHDLALHHRLRILLNSSP